MFPYAKPAVTLTINIPFRPIHQHSIRNSLYQPIIFPKKQELIFGVWGVAGVQGEEGWKGVMKKYYSRYLSVCMRSEIKTWHGAGVTLISSSFMSRPASQSNPSTALPTLAKQC